MIDTLRESLRTLIDSSIIPLLETVRTDLEKARLGNVAAARRSRVGLVELEKRGKAYRKKSTDLCGKIEKARQDRRRS